MNRAALEAAGVPEPDRVLEAAAPLAAWLAAASPDEVVAGLAAAAEPAAALHALARLQDQAAAPPAAGEVAPLLRILGGSPALAAAAAAEGAGWPGLIRTALAVDGRDVASHRALLADAGAAGPIPRERLQHLLRHHRRRELVRIGGRDLLGLASVDDTVRELSRLAEATIDVAVGSARARLAAEWVGDAAGAFAVLGMGKLGGTELNYSSDVDLVYLYERDAEHPSGRTAGEFFTRLAEELTRALAEVTADGLCVRVDLRLRPGGGEGPLAVSLATAVAYFEAWGQTWERAAWLKARPVGGDRLLGERLLAELEPFVYRRYLDFGTVEDLKAMKRRVDASVARRKDGQDVKLGHGGIREVEFFVQAHQLIHGGKDARLRTRATLDALGRLASAGYVGGDQAAGLASAYRFLRDVEHKLQVVGQRQTHVVPAAPEAVAALARRTGFLGAEGSAAFRAALAQHTGVVTVAYGGLFDTPEEERRRAAEPALVSLLDELDDEAGARARLGELGFRDPAAAARELRLLRDGPPAAPASARRRAALRALAPSLLAEIARSAAPDRALRHLATFISAVGARTSYLHLLLENGGVMRLLVRLFATSELLSGVFLRRPELLDSLVRTDLVRLSRPRADMAAELAARLAAAPDFETELDELRRFRHEEFLRIGVHDIEGELEPDDIGAQLTDVAEVCLEAALALGRREVLRRTNLAAPAEGLVVLGMGRLGGRELNYNSDLDLIFVYEAGEADSVAGRGTPPEVFTRIAQRAMSVLQTPTREGIVYRIDTRLRPSGNQGPLVCSFAAFEAYHRASAAVWERQALIKARPLLGPPALRERLAAAIDRFVYGRGLEPAERAEIARMRERIEQERGGAATGQVNVKTGRGGLVDVQFIVQVLQLRHGHTHPEVRVRTTREALEALAAAGLLGAGDARALAEAQAFLHAIERRLRIEHDQPAEAFDAHPEAFRALARRLGYEGGDAEVAARLAAEHRRHRDAVCSVYDRIVTAD